MSEMIEAPPVAAWATEFERSEGLDAFMAVAVRMYELNIELGRFLQIHVILDTSIVVEDLIGLVRTENEKHRRPAIFELVAKKTLIAYFPLEKIIEVEEKCTEIAARYGIPRDRIVEHWTTYRKQLHFVPTYDLEREHADVKKLATRDPSDVAFLQTRHIVGASVVLSKDNDIRDSGAPVMPWSRVLVDLRHYSRKHGLQVAVFLGTGTAIMLPIAALIGCVRLMYQAFKSLPKEALVVCAVGIGIALLVPESRAFLIRTGRAALDKAKDLGTKIGPFVGEAMVAAKQAKVKAEEMRPTIDRALRSVLKGRLTLKQACYRVCLVAQRPLTLDEIWKAAARDGARSRARNPLKSILRALRGHRLLMSLPDGRWQATALAAPSTSNSK